MSDDAKPARLPKFYPVPAGTAAAVCRGKEQGGTCAAVIYWVTNPATNRPIPVDCDVEGGLRPSETNDPTQTDAFTVSALIHDGRGWSHFATCPDFKRFSGKGKS